MNRPTAVFLFAAVLVFPAREIARADNEPLIWPDGTITYRDWGLYRPGVPILIERPYSGYYGYPGGIISKDESKYPPAQPAAPAAAVPAVPRYYPGSYHEQDYFPSNHRDPDAYKPKPPIRPVPAQPYFRSWGTESDMTPATQPQPEGPSVIYAPDVDVETRRRR